MITAGDRLKKFESFKTHIIQGKLYRRLSAAELEQCRIFICTNDGLDENAFALKANRWMLNEAKPKNYSIMWALVLQSNPPYARKPISTCGKCGSVFYEVPARARVQDCGDDLDGSYWECRCRSTLFVPKKLQTEAV